MDWPNLGPLEDENKWKWLKYVYDLIYYLLWRVWLMGCAICFNCIDWWDKGWHMVACPFCALVVLYRMLPMFIWYEMFNAWAIVSTIAHLECFRPRAFFVKKIIGLVSIDLPYIIFTYYNQDNQQECFRLSNWFSLCLGPWMNHLPPIWWPNFRFMILNESWCVSLTLWRGIFYWCLVFIIVFIYCPNVTFIVPLTLGFTMK